MALNRIKPLELPDHPPDGGSITNITEQKKDVSRCSLFLDGTYAFGLHVDLVLKHGLKKDQVLTGEECAALIQEDLYFKGFKRILDYIAYRPRTRKEINTRLKQLAIPESPSEAIVSRLDELGYINDAAFAEQWAVSRFRSKGFGPLRIKQELSQKGIPASVIEEVVANAIPEKSLTDQLTKQVDGAFNKYRKEADPQKKRTKIVQFLARRGYSGSTVFQMIDAKMDK